MEELQIENGGSVVFPELRADQHIWDREYLETFLGRPLTIEEEQELWDTGEIAGVTD